MAIAFLGLRSGSIGLPNKNIRSFHGKPLFAWIVDQCIRSELVDRLIISTDSSEYIRLIKGYCDCDIIKRPAELAQPNSRDEEFILHSMEHLNIQAMHLDTPVLRVVATNPLQTHVDIDECIRALDNPIYKSSMAIASAGIYYHKALSISHRGNSYFVEPLDGSGSNSNMPRQASYGLFKRSNIICTRLSTFLSTHQLINQAVAPIFVPLERSIDIDTLADWNIASSLLAGYSTQEINYKSFMPSLAPFG